MKKIKKPPQLKKRGNKYPLRNLVAVAVHLLAQQNTLYFAEDLFVEMGISKALFYKHKMHEIDVIKEGLLKNKTITKKGLRNRWYLSDSPATQIALYKLMASKDELNRLTHQKIESENENRNKNVYEVVTRIVDPEKDRLEKKKSKK